MTFSMLKRSYLCIHNVIFDETVGCFVILERWVPRRRRSFTINFFSFWEIRGISELRSNQLPATVRTLVNTLYIKLNIFKRELYQIGVFCKELGVIFQCQTRNFVATKSVTSASKFPDP